MDSAPRAGPHGRPEDSYGVIRSRIDCAAWTVQPLSARVHWQSGLGERVAANRAPVAIPVNSFAELFADFLCKGRTDWLIRRSHLVREADAVRSARRFFSVPTATDASGDSRYRLLDLEDADAQLIDEKSIKEDGPRRKFSLLIIWPQPRSGGGESEPASLHDEIPMRVDCAAWTMQTLSGRPNAGSGTGTPLVHAILPGSVAETAADYVCKGKLDPDISPANAANEAQAVRGAMRFLAVTGWGSAPPDPAYRLIAADGDAANYLDESAIARAGATREYWILGLRAKPERDRYGAEHPYARYQLRIDCAAWTTQALKVIPYTKRGPDQLVSLAAEPQRIDPDSATEATANFLCKGELDPAIAARHLVSQDEAVREALSNFVAAGRPRDARGR
ncbi:MAG TPA: surface-adhesin E family protein [Allosphingosinicella sp.]